MTKVVDARRRPGGARPGHRLIPHPSELLIEAWGPDEAACILEALKALVESFADPLGCPPTTTRSLVADGTQPEDALVSLLESVIFRLDAYGEVPVNFSLSRSGRGFCGAMDVVGIDHVALIGSVPKAVSYHTLEVVQNESGWRCRVLVDV